MRFAWSGTVRVCASSLVFPAPTATSTSRFAATIAAGLDGIEHRTDPGDAFQGNAYESHTAPGVPWNIVDAIDELADSKFALQAFGPEVHHHLVTTARQEWAAFGRVVTDWERRRCFEQY